MSNLELAGRENGKDISSEAVKVAPKCPVRV